ncbi:hypothetical protein FSP39_024244 [Pinctada imbricata]|uniref:Uncharacterized protein n=1 Tax=Pinctada imbricata TaxID=66713 RepID=A0AA88YNX1_PINIB|nr:hypothetical protein FSP39_024244 [Pinctada imbricata]
MTEPKRMQLTTVAPKTDDKSAKNTTVTVRLDLTLVDSTDTSCSEFFYNDLVKKASGPEKGEGKQNTSSDDPFGDEDAEQRQVEALAKKFEAKYGPKPGSKKKKRLGRIQDLVDLGDGYDVEDPFIDNSEAYDEVVPGSLITRHGGFYINSGKLDFKEIKDDSDDDFVVKKKKGKKRTKTSDSESDEEEKVKKKIKLKEGVLGEKKKKKLLNADGEKIFKKPKKPIDKEKLAKKKKTSPTVSELLKQQSQSTSAPVSHTNGSLMDMDVGSPSTNDSGSSQDAKAFDDRIDSIIDSVIAMNKGDQKNLDSIILDSSIGLDKEDSNGKDDIMKSIDPANIPSLPSNMSKELESTIIFLKEKAKNSRDGKCKFFTNEVNDKLLVVEVESKKLGSCGQRSKIYNHLAAYLPCSKDTLLKRAKKLHQSRQDDELKEPVQKLQDAINGMMPALQEKYEAECQRQALLKQDDGNKEETPKGNDTEDSEDEKSQSNNDAAKKGPKGVRKKFEWTESIRSLLCQIVGIKMKSFDVVKKGNQTAEEFLKLFLDRDIRPLWPKGWMQTRTLFKESRAAHSIWTAPQKPKKIGNVLMSKSTPNNSTNNTPTATNNNIPKFSPGSTPARPSTYEELTREMAQKSQSASGVKPTAAKSVPTILDYASKGSVSEGNKTNNAQDAANVSSASAGLSLLASSAANQKYMDQAWDHVVSDIIKSSLSPKKAEQVSPNSVKAVKAGDSFFEQFQKHLQQQQKQVQQPQPGTKAVGTTLDINQAKKMASLLLQNKALNPQQIQQKMKPSTPQGQSNNSAKPDSATKSTTPKSVLKPELGATAALQKQVPSVQSAKPKTAISLTSEEVYRKFLQESGNLPQKTLNITSSQPVHKSVNSSNQVHVSQVQKSNSTKAHTPGQSSAQSLLLNTLSSNLNAQKVQGAHKSSLSMMDYSPSSGNSHALPRMKTPTQRTSPGNQMPRPVISPQGQSSVKSDSSSSAMAAELMQQLFGKADSHSSGMHSYSKLPSPSSTHSYAKQPSPSGALNKSVSPSGMQGKSISPSSLYSNKSVSPTAQGKAQNTVWSVASMTQGASQKSSTSPFTQPQVPQVNKPLPGYQTLKMTNYPRDTSPASGSTSIPLSPVQTHLPSPDILSPLGMSPTNPLFPATQNSLLQGHYGQTNTISQQADSNVLGVCPTTWSEHNGRCYFFSTQTYRYTEANILCNQRNASILSYRDDADWDFVGKEVEKGTRTQYWIALRVVNGSWTWMDGTQYNKTEVHWYRDKEAVTNRRSYDCASFRSYKPYVGQLFYQNCNARQRINQPGMFKGADNQTLRYQPFYSYGKVILQKGGTCVYANPLASFYWESELCTAEKKFICEKQAGRFNTNLQNVFVSQGWSKYNDNCYQLIDVASYEATWFMASNTRASWIHGYCYNPKPFICKAKVITTITSNSTAPSGSTHCESGWVPFRGDCYYFGVSGNSSGYSWSEARRMCYQSSADLTTIRDPYEQSFIAQNQLDISTAWIGLKYRDEYKRMIWVDQSSLSFANFYPGEPDDITNGQECIKVVGGRQDYSGAWDDGNCTNQLDYICRKQARSWTYQCGPGWIYNSLNGYCYQVVLGAPKTWSDAQWACQQLNSSLLSIEGPREQNFIQAVLNTGRYRTIQFNFWMGGSDISQEGGWEWTDPNIPFAYLNWHPGEPNEYGVGEDCMEIVPGWSYQWNDKRCDHEQQYICKKQESCVPTALISGNYSLLDDSKLTSSSSLDNGHQAANSRIYQGSRGGWSAATTNNGEYIQVTFYDLVIIKGIVTMGRSDADEYVTQYKIRYQYDTFSKWVWYEQPPGTIKVFTGNSDISNAVTNSLMFPIESKSIRLYPVQWHNKMSLRWDVMGCMETKCKPDYGMSGPLIVTDQSITVSSMSDPYHNGNAARIRPIDINVSPRGWEALNDDSNQWIKVDLGKSMIIRGITTMGSPTKQEWVTSYKVSFSTGSVDYYYQEPYGNVFVCHMSNIPANTDNIHQATYFFKAHFQARYVKIMPTTFHNSIALRLDILVDLSTNIQVVAVATQGRQDSPEWVKAYTLSYSQDGIKYYTYTAFTRKAIVFSANFDQNTVRKQYLSIPVIARYIRLWPTDYNRQIALRWEVYGCPGPDSGTTIGCFSDNPNDRDLSFEPYTDPSVGMWPPMCVHHCFEKGYYYAGLQNQYQCFCGNSYGRYGPASQCNLSCYPATQFKCGGKNANTVYSTGLTARNKICKPNWREYKGSCYLLLTDRRSWGDARAECQKQGADLVTINSQPEQDLIYSVISNGGGRDVWIGLNDMREENLFEWARGNRVRYTNWNVNQPRQPSNIEQDCVMINPQTGGWQDENCDTKHQYVCQADKQTSNKPTPPRSIQGCPKGWDGYRWSCYLYIEMPRTFAAAMKVCRENKGTLVQIDDKYEQSYLSSVLGTKSGKYWTDITDLKSPGTYRNYESPLTYLLYSNWGGQQPTGLNLRCVAMNSGNRSGLWYDMPCINVAKAVCESLRIGYTKPTLPPTTPPTLPCPGGWVGINDYCYQVNTKPKNQHLNYDEASRDCVSQGATLASLHSSNDSDTLWSKYLTMTNTGNYWIGLNDKSVVGNQKVYRWTDGTALDFTKWAPKQPDNYKGREDCVELVMYQALWNDQVCSNRRNWICKVKRGQKVTPRTTPPAPTAGSDLISDILKISKDIYTAGIACGKDLNWMTYKGHCYYVVDGVGSQSKSWREARRWCQSHSAELISITSVFEQLFIQNQIKNTTAFSFWTGFSETDFDLGYKWSDGSPASYINWRKGEPNDFYGAEDCVEIMVYSGQWNDAHCATKKGFICEKSLSATPPTTPSPVIKGNCPSGFSAYGNMCFRLYTNQPKTWSDASKACQALGRDKYYLASIRNPLENAFITSLLSDMSSTPWIGLSRAPRQQYRWVDNEDLTYTNWYHGEPNGAANMQMCGRVYSYQHSAGEWDDVPCNQTNAYICETKKKTSITTAQPVPNPCDYKQGFKPYGNDCLLYVNTPKSWMDASTYCQTKGAFLASIPNVFEQTYVFLTINDPSSSLKTAAWIGLSDQSHNGTYTWVNSIWSVTYTKWKANEPSRQPGENCVAMGIDGLWTDEQCASQKPFVCKITTALPPLSPPPPLVQCHGSDWILHKDKCYLFVVKTAVSFLDATIACTQHRANVVSIHSMDENQYLVSTLQIYTTQSEGFWTSFHKSPQAGFEWFDGSPKNFINWDTSEPSGKNQRGNEENCVEVRSWNGKWNDLDCTLKRGYICETIPAVDPSANTMPAIPSPTSPLISPGLPASQRTPALLPKTSPKGSQTTPSGPPKPPVTTFGPTRQPTKAPTPGPTVTPHVIPPLPPIGNITGNGNGRSSRQTGSTGSNNNDISGGALAGILVAVVLVAAAAVVALVIFKRRNQSSTPALSFENTAYDATDGKVQFSHQNGSNNVAKFTDDDTES